MGARSVILGLLWMALANAACLLGAHALLVRLRTGRAWVDAALFLLLRFFLASTAVLIAGLAGQLNGTALGIGGGLALGALLCIGAHRELPRVDLAALRERVPRFAWIVGGLILARLLLEVWFFSPHVGDALGYHLPKVAEWVQSGAITRETGIDFHSPLPGGFELCEIWWTVFLHHDVLIEMAGMEVWLLAFAAVVGLARWAGLDERASLLAAFLFGTAPVVLLQVDSCLNDLPVASILLASAALVTARVHPLLLLLPVGVGLGVKPTFGFAIPGLLILAYLVRGEPARARPAAGLLVGLAVLALGLGSYWYLRNAVLYGNPIHPATARGLIHTDNEWLVQQVGPSLLSLKENLRRLTDSRIYDDRLPYNPLSEMTTGWGPAVFGCGLPALLLGLRESGRFRRLALAFGVSMVSVLSLVASDWWFSRFVLFVPALLCIGAARLLREVRGTAWLLGAAIAIQFVCSLTPDSVDIGGYASMMRSPWRERAAGGIADLPRDREPIACLQGGSLHVYLLYGPDLSRKVPCIRTSDPGEVVAEMRRLGVRRIYGPGAARPVLEGCVRKKLLKPGIGSFYLLP